jgi:hypothetical protein
VGPQAINDVTVDLSEPVPIAWTAARARNVATPKRQLNSKGWQEKKAPARKRALLSSTAVFASDSSYEI